MKRNNKGFSLAEVIAAIVIVSFAVLMIGSIFITSNKINHNMEVKKNILSKYESTMNSFTADPTGFQSEEVNYVFYTNSFTSVVTESGDYNPNYDDYFKLTYKVINNNYTLTIEIYKDNVPYAINNIDTLSRTIRVKP